MKYPARVHLLGETIKFLRRKPSGGRASWHSKEREVRCSAAECPSGELAVKTYWSMILEAGVDIGELDLKGSDVRALTAIVTDGFIAFMEVVE